ncbi:family 43 glycosylhydrolase [Devosia nitrariae]|uniref:Glycosyl hydrolase n=1 Tax=Devosia nitrariae TaxID=2071872 RepID=A0ABQ5VZK4_9HYPH|nr:family 43 glycosylhydrolase [Devosia nitrariae]GLQ53028.1 glycosyl hydrolase [Devosia nitrariae]
MSAPIYRDPIEDGAADPTIIHRSGTNEWWMFYTRRRASLDTPDFEWIHGSPIGVAVSRDGGLTWSYRGTVAGLDDPADTGLNTHWAPEIVHVDGLYHMYLSYITGTHLDWRSHRSIVHFTSPDLEGWTRVGPLPLPTDNAIDAAVAPCPDGVYRLWYKDEAKGSATWVATSPDLFAWQVVGEAIPGKEGGFPHEGPNVFPLGGYIWMIVDEWRGQAVFRSQNAVDWERQGLILVEPGTAAVDRRFARHADIVTQDGWAALYYFTHPEWDEAASRAPMTPAARATAIHMARLTVVDGRLLAERDIGPLALDPALQRF